MKKKKRLVAFVDFSYNFYDKHAIYSLSSFMNENGINVEYIHEKSFSKALIRIKQINTAILLYPAFSTHINTFIEFDKIVKKISLLSLLLEDMAQLLAQGLMFLWRQVMKRLKHLSVRVRILLNLELSQAHSEY